MKKMLFFVLLTQMSLACMGQTHTVARGSDGYITIDGQNYKRGDLLSQYAYRASDSSMGILFANTRVQLVKPTVDTNWIYVDSSSKKARNMTVLRTWMNTNFEYLH